VVNRLYLGACLLVSMAFLSSCMTPQALRFDEAKRSVEFISPAWSSQLYTVPNFAYEPIEKAQTLVVGNVAYLGGRDGVFRAIALNDGRTLWTVDMFEPIVARAVKVDEDLLIGSMGGKLYRVNRASGRVIWSYDVETSIVSRVAVSGGRVFTVNNKNALFALDAETGKYLWHKNRPHKTEFTMDGQGAPLAADGRLYVGFSDGILVCMAPEDGAVIWSRKLSSGDPRFGDVDSDPVRRGDKLFVTSFNGGVFALNPEDGTTIWSKSLTGGSTPTFVGGKLILASAEGELVALAETTGETMWRSSISEPGQLLSPPLRMNGYVATADGTGLIVIHSNSGSVVGKWNVGDGFSAQPSYSNGNLYTLSNSGVLYRFKNIQ